MSSLQPFHEPWEYHYTSPSLASSHMRVWLMRQGSTSFATLKILCHQLNLFLLAFIHLDQVFLWIMSTYNGALHLGLQSAVLQVHSHANLPSITYEIFGSPANTRNGESSIGLSIGSCCSRKYFCSKWKQNITTPTWLIL